MDQQQYKQNIYKLKKPKEYTIEINKYSINNLIKFVWTDYIENTKSCFKKCNNSYYGDNIFYSFHIDINIIKYLKKDILERFLVLDTTIMNLSKQSEDKELFSGEQSSKENTELDHGLLKKAILIASLDDNFSILDVLIHKKIDLNKIYFDNMSLLEYSTHLFRNNDNYKVIEMLILCGADINKPFRDGSFFFHNFIDVSTRMTVSKVTALNKTSFELYKEEKMDEFYDIYFDYGIYNIDLDVYLKYIPFLLSLKINTTFKDIPYLMPEHKFKNIKYNKNFSMISSLFHSNNTLKMSLL